jgi:hypothetical protein
VNPLPTGLAAVQRIAVGIVAHIRNTYGRTKWNIFMGAGQYHSVLNDIILAFETGAEGLLETVYLLLRCLLLCPGLLLSLLCGLP